MLIEEYARQIRLSPAATRRWSQANRSGGPRHKAWMNLNDAVADELSRREEIVQHDARMKNDNSAQARNSQGAQGHGVVSPPVFPLQYAADNARIERECQTGELDVQKPMVKDELKEAINNAYNRSDFEEAKCRQDQLEKKLALERIKHQEKKTLKRNLKQCRARMDARPRGFDPNSDD